MGCLISIIVCLLISLFLIVLWGGLEDQNYNSNLAKQIENSWQMGFIAGTKDGTIIDNPYLNPNTNLPRELTPRGRTVSRDKLRMTLRESWFQGYTRAKRLIAE